MDTGAAETRPASRLRDRFATRLVAGMVLAFVPLTAVLAVLLVRNASDSLEQAARSGLQNSASVLAARVDVRFRERGQDLQQIARSLQAADVEDRDATVAILRDGGAAFEAVQVVDAQGRLLAGTDSSRSFARPASDWFAAATRGAAAIGQPFAAGGTLRTVLAQPVLGRTGAPVAIVLGDLDETNFAGFVADIRYGDSGEAVIRDSTGRLIWRTGLGRPRDARAMLERRPLADRTTAGAPALAAAGRTGTTRFVASTGNEALGGYAPATVPRWTADVRQDTHEAFEPIREQRNLAILVGVLGSLLVALFAVLFARSATRPVRELAAQARRVAEGDLTVSVVPKGAAETADLARSFNQMVANLSDLARRLRGAGQDLSSAAQELSSAAQEMATTTNEQSSAAQETSGTMQELATTVQSIAESVGGVEQRAKDTGHALESADADIQASSERTLALAGRVGEIGALLVLIDEIADRTNLLALNAAIEAARAGEAGAGFSVVADEVRRLAERSKGEAGKIKEIITATQAETNATVMAMEAGSKQMRHGLALMDEVTDAVSQVRYTTDEQRVATDQVVDAMGAVSATSRQAAASGQQIAGSAQQIARLAVELDQVAAQFRVTDGTPEPSWVMPPGPGPGPGAAG
ncbi:hypothetical protein DSM112329_03777 [Paraconexibacter sp. AEG42_29]|uniref:Methyl-accepting chemotaxis protein n=1 Tax=Paraconexibacter sp. AEG42_29 TaxID=2997339 RepID=A0AAU7AZ27_9ACTN